MILKSFKYAEMHYIGIKLHFSLKEEKKKFNFKVSVENFINKYWQEMKDTELAITHIKREDIPVEIKK